MLSTKYLYQIAVVCAWTEVNSLLTNTTSSWYYGVCFHTTSHQNVFLSSIAIQIPGSDSGFFFGSDPVKLQSHFLVDLLPVIMGPNHAASESETSSNDQKFGLIWDSQDL